MVRAGYNVPDDFGPPLIRPNVSGPGYVLSLNELGFYIFAGTEQRLIGFNIFLDGDTFTNSHSVNKKCFIRDLQFGAAILLGRMMISYSYVLRTKEFNGQSRPDRFGAFSLSFNL